MAKAGNPPKVDRNQALIERRDQTDLSFSKLGEMFNISKQAAWVIYQRGNTKTKQGGDKDTTYYQTHQNRRWSVLWQKLMSWGVRPLW